MLPTHQAGLLSQRLPHNVHPNKAGLLDQTTLDTLNTLFITLSMIHYCVYRTPSLEVLVVSPLQI